MAPPKRGTGRASRSTRTTRARRGGTAPSLFKTATLTLLVLGAAGAALAASYAGSRAPLTPAQVAELVCNPDGSVAKYPAAATPLYARLHLAEFNDHPSAPRALAAFIVRMLGPLFQELGVLEGVTAPYATFVQAAATSPAAMPDRDGAPSPRPRILDLASGSGVPALTLARELKRTHGMSVALTLSDLVPRPDAWAALPEVASGEWSAEARSVDAVAPPPALAKGAALTMVTAFHHLPPAVAREAFTAAGEAKATGFFLAEPFDRDLRAFLPLLVTAPTTQAKVVGRIVVADAKKTYKAEGVWPAVTQAARTLALTPPATMLGILDGVISVLRTYTESELRCLASPLTDAGWEVRFGYAPFLKWGAGYYFYATAP